MSGNLDRQFRTILAAVLGAVLLLSAASGASGEEPRQIDEDPGGASYVAGELIVTYSSAPARSTGLVARQSGAQIERDIPAINAQLLSFPEVADERAREARERTLERIKEALERNPAVAAVDYNYLRTPSWTPNDPRFDEQWGLRKIQAPRAWDSVRGTNASRIAVLDSGVARHPDLESRIAGRRDFTGSGSPADRSGHGTHVAGIAAAATNNNRGVAGACPGCTLLIGKVIGDDGRATVADEVDGIIWAANHGAKVINLSLGGAGRVTSEENAINYAWNRGAVVVAAAGNESSTSPQYPAGYDRTLAVAATDRQDRRASFSNHGNWVSVAAPGVGVLSTFPGGYRQLSGTSMATPHVSGVAGLLASQNFTNAQIRNRLQNNSRSLPFVRHGRIDAYRATFRPYRQVVDNASKNRFRASHNWNLSSWHPQRYGPNYHVSRPGSVIDPARFRMAIPHRGNYAVYARWPADSRFNERARFQVRTTSGWRAQPVDQRRNGGRWVYLGTYNMAAADEWNVRLLRQTAGSGFLIADAVMVVRR
jgi:thermitase